jgi:hypothetical protein
VSNWLSSKWHHIEIAKHDLGFRLKRGCIRQACNLGAGQTQHLHAVVERSETGCIAREQFDHPPGTSADVEGAAKRRIVQQRGHRGFDFGFGHMQRPQAVPFGGVLVEIARGHFSASFTDFGQAGQVAFYRPRFSGSGQREKRRDRRMGEHWPRAQEYPTAFLVPLDDARLVQYADMARNPWLALFENQHHFADRQFELPHQKRDSQPRRIGKCTHYVEQRGHDKRI